MAFRGQRSGELLGILTCTLPLQRPHLPGGSGLSQSWLICGAILLKNGSLLLELVCVHVCVHAHPCLFTRECAGAHPWGQRSISGVIPPLCLETGVPARPGA